MLQTFTCETVPMKHSRCSSLLGVPLSTQWGPQGYFYPIQIAQYGLSHYSKNLTEKPPHIEVYETAEEKDRGSRAAEWTVPKGCSLSTVPDKAKFTSVKHFVAPGGLWQADGWLAQLVAGGLSSISPGFVCMEQLSIHRTSPQDIIEFCTFFFILFSLHLCSLKRPYFD